MTDEKLLNTQETLARLKVSRKTLYALMERGKIKPIDKPAFLTKRPKLLFHEADVEKLLSGESDEDEPHVVHVAAVA